jgi:vacuolar protein sorting-associated protein 13A/C
MYRPLFHFQLLIALQIIMNHKSDKDTPRFDVQLLFDEIGVVLDDSQYRDAISLVDMYHVYVRQHQVSSSRYNV